MHDMCVLAPNVKKVVLTEESEISKARLARVFESRRPFPRETGTFDRLFVMSLKVKPCDESRQIVGKGR